MKKKKNGIKGELTFKIIVYTFLSALMLLVIYPFAIAFFSSFKTAPEVLTSPDILPKEWMFNNYFVAWKTANFARYTFNSLWYTAVIVVIGVFTGTVNGYAFARGKFRGKNAIFALFTSMMFITLGTSSMYPTLQILKLLHLNTSLWGLCFKAFFGLEITRVFLVRGFLQGIPKALDEAAEIDGCDFIKTFFFVILPLLKPIIATTAIMAFGAAWNDYLMPMVVTLANPAQRTLPVGMVALKATSGAATSWNLILAGGMMSAIPMIIVYLFFNRYFINGLAAGAVKG